MIRIAFLLAFMLFFAGDVLAQNTPPIEDLFPNQGSGGVNIDGIQGDNTDKKGLLHYIPRLIDIFIKFVAPIILVTLVIAGIKMIISGDQQEEVEKGKKILLYSLIGVVLILISYSLIRALYYFFVTA